MRLKDKSHYRHKGSTMGIGKALAKKSVQKGAKVIIPRNWRKIGYCQLVCRIGSEKGKIKQPIEDPLQ